METKTKQQGSRKDLVKLIKAIYFYGMMVFSIVMLSVGFYRSAVTFSNFVFLEEYPYPGEEYACDFSYMLMDETKPLDRDLYDEKVTDCKQNGELSRQKAKVNDVSSSIASLAIGVVVLAYHAPKTKDLDKD